MTDAVSLFNRTVEALNRGDADLPLADIDRALVASPSDYRLWHIKGLAHRAQDQRELAVPALRRAADLAPGEPLIAHGYARTLLEAGLPSADAFITAFKLETSNRDIISGLASALVAEGQVGEAVRLLEGALERGSSWPAGHRQLAEIRWAHGEQDRFTSALENAIARNPRDADLWLEYIGLLLDADQFELVLTKVEDASGAIGSQPILTALEAAVRSELGDTDAADRLFADIEERQDPATDLRYVRHLLRSGRVEAASPIVDRWIGTAEEPMFLASAATIWRLTGDARADWLEGDDRLVGVHDIGGKLPELDKLVDLLRRLHQARSQPLAQSVCGGTQTEGNLFHRIEPEIVQLREVIRAAVAEHMDALPHLDEQHPLSKRRPGRVQFAGSWSVRLDRGGSHKNHVHPAGWLSSALYLVLPPDLGAGENAGWLTLGEPDARLGLDLSPRRMVEPRIGRLALFPSWMWHGTRPFGQGERMTVAFDVAPRR